MNKASLSAAVIKLFRPLVRILLRHGIPYGAFSDLAKRVYVEVANEEFGIKGRAQSISRISIITGLTRKEVRRVMSLPEPQDYGAIEQYNRAARVISGWVRDSEFWNPDKQPADLLIDGEGPTFSGLVKKYSGDMPIRAVLDELLRVGAVEKAGKDRIKLLSRAYIPSAGKEGKLLILGTDVKDLISTIDHNLTSQSEKRFFQRKVSYDNLPSEALPDLRKMTHTRAQDFLENFDRWLAQNDRDTNADIKGSGRKRAGLGIFYFEEDIFRKEDHKE